MLKEKTSCDEVAGDTTGSKKQLQLTPQLKMWLANLLTPLIDSEADPDDKIMLNALQRKGSHGRSDGIEQIIQRIAVSDHPTVKNKTTTGTTLTRWINECMLMGRTENDRVASDSSAGRKSSENATSAEVAAWSYLMQSYDEFKANQEKAAVKVTRYNRLPDHLQGTGIVLIKCDSAFLPGSGGKEDLQEAIKKIQANKASSLQESAEEAAAGMETERKKPYLYPTAKRVKVEDVDSDRRNLFASMAQMVSIKSEEVQVKKNKAAAEQAAAEQTATTSQIAAIYAEINHCVNLSSNPSLPNAVKENFMEMVSQAQEQIKMLRRRAMEAAAPPPFSADASFITPPRHRFSAASEQSEDSASGTSSSISPS